MRILGISGSPRFGGNSEILLEHAINPFVEANWDVSRIHLSKMRIMPCIGCESCLKNGYCHIDDDMKEIYAAFESCDAVIISSPTYWKNIPSQLKAVIDRTFAIWNRKPLVGKHGGVISVGRGVNGGQSIVQDVLFAYLRFCGVFCVSLDYDVTAIADAPGDILNQTDILEKARLLGNKILDCSLARYIN